MCWNVGKGYDYETRSVLLCWDDDVTFCQISVGKKYKIHFIGSLKSLRCTSVDLQKTHHFLHSTKRHRFHFSNTSAQLLKGRHSISSSSHIPRLPCTGSRQRKLPCYIFQRVSAGLWSDRAPFPFLPSGSLHAFNITSQGSNCITDTKCRCLTHSVHFVFKSVPITQTPIVRLGASW